MPTVTDRVIFYVHYLKRKIHWTFSKPAIKRSVWTLNKPNLGYNSLLGSITVKFVKIHCASYLNHIASLIAVLIDDKILK